MNRHRSRHPPPLCLPARHIREFEIYESAHGIPRIPRANVSPLPPPFIHRPFVFQIRFPTLPAFHLLLLLLVPPLPSLLTIIISVKTRKTPNDIAIRHANAFSKIDLRGHALKQTASRRKKNRTVETTMNKGEGLSVVKRTEKSPRNPLFLSVFAR